MDIFTEQLVKRKWQKSDYLRVVLVIVFSLLLFLTLNYACIVIGLGFSIFPFLLAGLIFLDWWLINSMRLEYEYSLTNGDLTIDEIIARRRRKRVIQLDVRDAEVFRPYEPRQYAGRQFPTILELNSGAPDDQPWCLEITHRSKGKTLLIFSPSERFLKAVRPFLKRQVALDGFGRN